MLGIEIPLMYATHLVETVNKTHGTVRPTRKYWNNHQRNSLVFLMLYDSPSRFCMFVPSFSRKQIEGDWPVESFPQIFTSCSSTDLAWYK